MRSRKILFGKAGAVNIFIACFLLASIVYANDPLKPLFTKKPPVIDGVLDDEIWKLAPSVTGFKTFIPDFGKDQSQKTVVYMAYDKENLYFAFKCYDKEPDKIKASVTSRDNTRPDDWICINLDSFNDQQSLYAFYVNPFGIQSDSKSVGQSEDTGMDFVWYSAGKIDNEGYVVEVQLPLKSIRYADTNPVQMAVFFERRIARHSEQGSFPPLDPAKGYSFMTQLQPMFYYDVDHYTLFEMIPAVTFNQKYVQQKGKLSTSDVSREFGLTLKYGLTSDLILDGTYNPDFSQVEADAGQVDINLRSKLFNAEKRPFFLEGRDNYVVAGTSSTGVDPVAYIFHSRTIENPIVGFKLSGKISANGLLSTVYAADEPAQKNGSSSKYSHVPIIRYKQALSNDSFIGGIAGSIEKEDYHNRVYGIDGQIRTSGAGLLEFNGIFSNTKPASVSGTYYGNTFSAIYNDGTRDLDYFVSAKTVSKDFQADMGHITRTGIMTGAGLIRPKIYPNSTFFRRIDLEAFSAQTKDLFYNMWETFNYASVNFVLIGNLALKVKYSYSTEIYLGERFKTGGYHATVGGWFNKNFSFDILYRRLNAIYYSNNPLQGKSNVISAEMIILPSDKLQSQTDFNYSDFTRSDNGEMLYKYPIIRTKLTYQINQYLFFRGIVEYNNYRKQIVTDLLASFTYIPGTVIHIGYGSMYERVEYDGTNYRPCNNFMETKRGFFFKASYLWRV